MRYSRFKSSMLGLDPQKRNRANQAKSKVTKPKRDTKAKKEELVKQDPGTKSGVLQTVPEALSPEIKRETSQARMDSEPPSMPVTGVTMPDSHFNFHSRLLTPCSDTDLLGTSQSYATSPASEMVQSEPFDFAAPVHCTHDHASWPQGSGYQTYGMPYELDSYAAGFCEHQHTHHPTDGLCVPSAIMNPDPGHVSLKHEEWDANYRDV